MKSYIKHLIECNCILPQFRNMKEPIFHKFVVFTIIDEEDKIEEKITQCPNCKIVHKIIEIGKSTILKKENSSSIRTLDDIAVSLPENIVAILESHNVDITVYEEVEFIIENKLWGSQVIIAKESVDDITMGKIMIIKNENLVKIDKFTREEYLH